jgi:hypothetical protein
MNVEIGTEAGHFPGKEYINGSFVAVLFSARNIFYTNFNTKNYKKEKNNVLISPFFTLLLSSPDTGMMLPAFPLS